ncbi:MAG: hypothetical protein K6G63_01495 [Eubacterium sp.]|nr:hypothetical protein [Eubacterium sp.]
MKTFVDKLWSFFKTQWLMIWIVVAALTLSALAVLADFLNSNTNMKRVVVATALNGKMFSSDWTVRIPMSTSCMRCCGI